jgi:Baculovirus F protein
MKFCLFITTLVSLASTGLSEEFSKPFNIDILQELQGLQFELIGNLKLIVETKTLIIKYNLSDLSPIEDSFNKKIEKIKKACNETKADCKYELDKLSDIFWSKKYELSDLLGIRRRNKRWLPFLTIGDGEVIASDLKELTTHVWQNRQYLQFMHGFIGHLTNFSSDSLISLVNATTFNANATKVIQMTSLINSLFDQMMEYEEKIKSIYRVFVGKRMDSDVISVKKFNEELTKISENLSGDRELAFANVRDIYNNIETLYQFENGSLIFKMEIPIAEKCSKHLFKIRSLPARAPENKLLLLDTKWSHLANDSKHIATFISLETCLKTNDKFPTYFCELQSPLYSIDSAECLPKTFKDRKIDVELCKPMIRAVEFTKLTLIHNDNNEYFYFTNRVENIKIFCHGKKYDAKLTDMTGIIKLSPGCSVITDQIKLLATHKSQEIEMHGALKIEFDNEGFERKVKEIRAESFSFKNIIEGSKELHEMFYSPIPKSPENIDEYLANVDFLKLICCLLIAFIALIALYCLYRVKK